MSYQPPETIIDDHLEAVKAMIPAALTVHKWEALKDPQNPREDEFPYVILWGETGIRSEALGPEPTEFQWRMRVTCAGIDAGQLSTLIGRVRNSLNGKTPVIPGRSVGELWGDPVLGIQPDDDITFPDSNRHPLYAVDEYFIQSSAG